MQDESRGWLFACPDDVAQQIDLDLADAPRRVSHSLAAKRARPAVSEADRPDRFGPDTWERILSRLPVAGCLSFTRSNVYESARLFRLSDETTDYLATWTPETVDQWGPTMDAIGHKVVEDFADHPSWQPLHGGAVGALMKVRGLALMARSDGETPAGVYYYWYVPVAAD